MKWLLVFLTCVFSLLNLSDAHAENVTLDEVVVTATRSEALRSQIPASITVITEKNINERQVSTVSDLLREVAGLDLVQQGGAGKITSVFIRGAKPEHTLILIDGIRVNSPTSGGFDFADLTVDNIERIEIIRSPLSTLYGSDAMGGVIQIFTKKAKASSASVSLEGGSYGTTKETVSTEVNLELYDMSLTASRWDTEGFSVFKTGSERDGYQNSSISTRLGKTTASGRMDLTARLIQGTTELDGCKFDAFFTPYDCDNPAYEQERRLALAGFKYQSQPRPAWGQVLSTSLTTERLVNRDPDPNGINSRIDTDIRTIDWQHNIHTEDGNQLTLGYEWQHREGVNRGNFSKDFSNHAIYLQEQRGVGKPVQLLAGIRWDESEIYESALTYRIGISYLPVENIKWHAQYGTGFRGPTLNDLFWPGAGNPDLKPEKSNGLELGVEQILSESTSLSLNYYENVYKNLIQWAPIDPSDPFSLWLPQNVGRAASSGWEGEVRWNPGSFLLLTGNYAYDDTEDKENGGYLIRRPLNKYGAKMRIGSPDRSVGIHFLHVGRRFDSQGNQNPLSSYNRIDLVGSYRLTGGLETFGRIENLLDKEYEEAKGYSVAGFSAYGGLRMTFR